MAAPDLPPGKNIPMVNISLDVDQTSSFPPPKARISLINRLFIFLDTWGLPLILVLLGLILLLYVFEAFSGGLVALWKNPKALVLPLNLKSLITASFTGTPKPGNLPTRETVTYRPTSAPTPTSVQEIGVIPPNPFQSLVVDARPKAGLSHSMVINQSGDVLIAYFNNQLDALILVWQNRTNWCTLVVVPGRMGLYPSSKLNHNGQVRFRFFRSAKNELVYATLNSAEWKFEIVAKDVEASATTLALTTYDQPRITFIDLQKNE